jgi:hypothetical protein
MLSPLKPSNASRLGRRKSLIFDSFLFWRLENQGFSSTSKSLILGSEILKLIFENFFNLFFKLLSS